MHDCMPWHLVMLQQLLWINIKINNQFVSHTLLFGKIEQLVSEMRQVQVQVSKSNVCSFWFLFFGAFYAFLKHLTLERWQKMKGKREGEWHATEVPGWTRTKDVIVHGWCLALHIFDYVYVNKAEFEFTSLRSSKTYISLWHLIHYVKPCRLKVKL